MNNSIPYIDPINGTFPRPPPKQQVSICCFPASDLSLQFLFLYSILVSKNKWGKQMMNNNFHEIFRCCCWSEDIMVWDVWRILYNAISCDRRFTWSFVQHINQCSILLSVSVWCSMSRLFLIDYLCAGTVSILRSMGKGPRQSTTEGEWCHRRLHTDPREGHHPSH